MPHSYNRADEQRPGRETEVTRQQAVVMVICNAVVSLLISLTVVLVFERYRASSTPEGMAVAQAGATPVSVVSEPASTSAGAEPAPVATYVVKSGDSLGSVAYRFGVTLDALMAANGLDNANYIVVGQSLVIPSGGAAPVATATPRPGPTMAPVSTPGQGQSPVFIESVVDGGQTELEYVRLANRGAQGVALEGWSLQDEDGHSFVFPNLFLWRNGTVSVHTGSGEDSATDLYWGLTEPVWDRAQEKVKLINAGGEVVAEVEVGAASGG